jgi:DNA-binding Lrp family transcriptional regulator
MHSTPAELDQFDWAILALLQQDNTTPQRTIGEAVHLSAASVQRRIRRLEASGIIQANQAVLNPAKLGQPLTLLVEITIEREQAALVDAVKARFAAAPEVQQCYYVTGEADFVLVVHTASMQTYEALTRRLFFDDPNIKHCRTLVVMDCVKVGLTLPLPNSQP